MSCGTADVFNVADDFLEQLDGIPRLTDFLGDVVAHLISYAADDLYDLRDILNGSHQVSDLGLHFIKLIGHGQETAQGRLDDFFASHRLLHRGGSVFSNMLGRVGYPLDGFGQLLRGILHRAGFLRCCLDCIEDVLDLVDLHDELEDVRSRLE